MKFKLFFFTILVIVISCASPLHSYKKGNYEKAFSSALKKIKSGKKERQLKSILNKSFEKLIEEDELSYNDLMLSDMLEDWEEAYTGRDKLIQMYDEGERYLDNDYDKPIQKARKDNVELEHNIVHNYIDLGDMNMEVYTESGDKYAAQEAYYAYRSARNYGYSDRIEGLELRQDEALIGGTIIIVIDVDTWASEYSWKIENRFNNIENYSKLFQEILHNEYVTNADCRIEIEFSILNITSNEQRNNQTYNDEIQDGYTTVVDTSGNSTNEPKYIQVSGQVTTIEETRTYSWDIRVDVDRGSSYCKFSDRSYNVSDQVVISQYEISGDERAIPSQDRNQRATEFSYSDEDRLVEALIERAYDNIVSDYF